MGPATANTPIAAATATRRLRTDLARWLLMIGTPVCRVIARGDHRGAPQRNMMAPAVRRRAVQRDSQDRTCNAAKSALTSEQPRAPHLIDPEIANGLRRIGRELPESCGYGLASADSDACLSRPCRGGSPR
jgi:hypothetical protein